MQIHPLACVAPTAKIGEGVRIGPFCLVEDHATIGDGCVLETRVCVKSGVRLGRNNHLFEGAVVGGLPQHVHLPDKVGDLTVGSGNAIRENVTIHRAMQPGNFTVVGDNCLLMCNAHVAHDCRIGDNVVLTNNVMLAGHVTVGARAFLSGGAGVHQFCRVGTLAMIGGLAHINRDVPPFVTIDGQSSYVVGLNQIGLKRAGYDTPAIARLKEAYRVIYRSGLAWKDVLEELRRQFPDAPAADFLPFLSTTRRGIIPERACRPAPRSASMRRRSRRKKSAARRRADSHRPAGEGPGVRVISSRPRPCVSAGACRTLRQREPCPTAFSFRRCWRSFRPFAPARRWYGRCHRSCC